MFLGVLTIRGPLRRALTSQYFKKVTGANTIVYARQRSNQQILCRSFSSSAPSLAPKAAALIIGNEILSGSIVDTNTPWLAKLLYSRGVDLLRVEYIPDDKADISQSVLKLKERVGQDGFVFTSGGIGPTHDDVTYEAIAAAFGVALELHQPTVERMKENYSKRGVELNDARLRMAMLPQTSQVLYTPDLWVPLVNLRGVYVLPGIPRLFQAMIEAHKEPFRGPTCSTATLYTNTVEGDLADPLRKVAQEHPGVSIGSYPNVAQCTDAQTFRVRLQLESRDKEALDAAVAAVTAAVQCIPAPAI
ncbi:g5507 [Coccomyxa elongata]